MKRLLQLCFAMVLAATLMMAVTPADPSTSKSKKKAPAKRKKAVSNGKAQTKAGKAGAKKSAAKKTVIKAPPVSSKVRAEAHDYVLENVATGADLPVENTAALIPFFEQLYRHQRGEMQGPLRILHYGDSHTAADEWTGDLRMQFQQRFGDGGSGFSLVPGKGYRRLDVRSGATRDWHSDGLVGKTPGDGVYGLGGLSLSVARPRESVYFQADGADFELFYYQQPGGGTLQLYDNGVALEQIVTDGEPGPAYYHLETIPGPHRVELETLDHKPVRLFGWVAENSTGVTYETLGINGAQASIVLGWNEETLRSNIERRNPALIVLAYGTNEAGRKDWTLESYREMYSQLIGRLRSAAPAATILVIGPPDRTVKVKGKGWQTMDGVDMIIQAQREAASANGCAFWDERAKMGGKGSMVKWVAAGMAQADHVHFTGPGYRMLGDAVFRDLMSQYDIFLKAREAIVAQSPEDTQALAAGRR